MCSNDLTATTQNIYLCCGQIVYHKIQQINFSGLYRKTQFYLQLIWGSPSCKTSNPHGAEESSCNETSQRREQLLSEYSNHAAPLSPELSMQQATRSSDTVDCRATLFVQDQKWAREKFSCSHHKKITKALFLLSFVWFSFLSENSRTENILIEPGKWLNQ